MLLLKIKSSYSQRKRKKMLNQKNNIQIPEHYNIIEDKEYGNIPTNKEKEVTVLINNCVIQYANYKQK